MRYVIISDIHIGSPYCRREQLAAFLAGLPAGVVLILNGDVLNNPDLPQTVADEQALDAVLAAARSRRVIWLRGNHDAAVPAAGKELTEVRDSLTIDDRLYIAHGHGFDDVMPHHVRFIRYFGRFHQLRVLLGARPVHVAEYAKKWRPLYRHLIRHVHTNAVAHAKANGIGAVVCGHVHLAEDMIFDGIHYLNTGAWTEAPLTCVVVDDDGIALRSVDAVLDGEPMFPAASPDHAPVPGLTPWQ